jgi:hypothetical protein
MVFQSGPMTTQTTSFLISIIKEKIIRRQSKWMTSLQCT